MRKCVLVPVFVKGSPGYMWRWRALEDGCESKFCFEYFHPCAEDARRCGYTVDMAATLEQARKPEPVPPEQYRPAPASSDAT